MYIQVYMGFGRDFFSIFLDLTLAANSFVTHGQKNRTELKKVYINWYAQQFVSVTRRGGERGRGDLQWTKENAHRKNTEPLRNGKEIKEKNRRKEQNLQESKWMWKRLYLSGCRSLSRSNRSWRRYANWVMSTELFLDSF